MPVYNNFLWKRLNFFGTCLANFVHYNPVKAIRENVPKERRQQQLSFDDYYRTYGTTEEVDGWRRVFLPQLEKTIYVK